MARAQLQNTTRALLPLPHLTFLFSSSPFPSFRPAAAPDEDALHSGFPEDPDGDHALREERVLAALDLFDELGPLHAAFRGPGGAEAAQDRWDRDFVQAAERSPRDASTRLLTLHRLRARTSISGMLVLIWEVWKKESTSSCASLF